jgi:hypothetical protein
VWQEVPGEEVEELKEFTREELQDVVIDVLLHEVTAVEERLNNSRYCTFRHCSFHQQGFQFLSGPEQWSVR